MLPPLWVAQMRFAEKFGCLPEQVQDSQAVWFTRWLLLEKTDQSKALHERWDGQKAEEHKKWSKEDRELRSWAFRKDEY